MAKKDLESYNEKQFQKMIRCERVVLFTKSFDYESIKCKKMFDFINEPFRSFELDLMEDGGVIEKFLIELTEQDRLSKMAKKDLEKYNENQLQQMIRCERVVLFTKTFDFESIECKKMFDFINEPFRSFELDLMEDGAVIEKLLIEVTEQDRPPWIYANDTFVGNRKSIQTLYNRGYLHLFVEDYPKLPGESSSDDD